MMFTKVIMDCYDDPWHRPDGKSYGVTGTAMCRSPKSATQRAKENLRSNYRKDPELGDHSLVLTIEQLFKGNSEIVNKHS